MLLMELAREKLMGEFCGEEILQLIRTFWNPEVGGLLICERKLGNILFTCQPLINVQIIISIPGSICCTYVLIACEDKT